MKQLIFGAFLAIAAGPVVALEPAPATPDLAPLRQAAGDFAEKLRGELIAALKAGGPAGAIGVCKEAAPAIAETVSEARGVVLRRTSLKTRNPANAPDEWELATLKAFLARKAAGEDIARLEAWRLEGEGADARLRFMKAIPTAEMCLQCHGTAIAPEVKAALAESYPQDRATGFSAGDIRGAFSITAPAGDKSKR